MRDIETMRFLLVIETQKVKSYLFASPIMRETRGASLLLDLLNRKESRGLLKEFDANNCKEIYLGGGTGRVLFRYKKDATKFKNNRRKNYKDSKLELVKQVANTGSANSAHIESSIETLFRFDADNVEHVYGSVAGVSHGVKVLKLHIDDKNNRDIDITKYVISLIMLEKKLLRNTVMLEEIDKRLKAIESQFEFFSLTLAFGVNRAASLRSYLFLVTLKSI